MKDLKDLQQLARDRARQTTRDIKYTVTLAGAFKVNQLGEVVSVHLAGCTFTPVEPEDVTDPKAKAEGIQEQKENAYQLSVALIAQAFENLAAKEVEKRIAVDMGIASPTILNHS